MTVRAKSQDIYVICTLCTGSGRDPLPQNFLDNCPLCNGTKFEIVGLNMGQVEMFRKGYEQNTEAAAARGKALAQIMMLEGIVMKLGHQLMEMADVYGFMDLTETEREFVNAMLGEV
jgi:hypothetical protein